MTEMKQRDLEKINMKVGKITAAKQHPATSDYIVLVDIGKTGADKQVVVDLKESYALDQLMGKKVVFIDNVEPVIVGEIESIGLLLVTYHDGKPLLVEPPKEADAGAKIVGRNVVDVEYHEEG